MSATGGKRKLLSDQACLIVPLMFTRSDFAKGLASAITEFGPQPRAIATWAFQTRVENIGAIDDRVKEWLTQLGAMDLGPEFELSGDELLSLVAEASQ